MGAVAYRVASPTESKARGSRPPGHVQGADAQKPPRAPRIPASGSRPNFTAQDRAGRLLSPSGWSSPSACQSRRCADQHSDALLGWAPACRAPAQRRASGGASATAMFVHTGLLQLVIDLVVLMRCCSSPLKFRRTTVYLSGGIMAGIANVSSHPVVRWPASASGPIPALYGVTAGPCLTGCSCRPGGASVARRGSSRSTSVAREEPGVLVRHRYLLTPRGIGGGRISGLHHGRRRRPLSGGFAVGPGYGAMLAALGGDRPAVGAREHVRRGRGHCRDVSRCRCAARRREAGDRAASSAAEEHATKAIKPHSTHSRTRDRPTRWPARGTARSVGKLQVEARRRGSTVHPEYARLVHDARDYLRLRIEAWAVSRRRRAALEHVAHPRRRRAAAGPRGIQAEARFQNRTTWRWDAPKPPSARR